MGQLAAMVAREMMATAARAPPTATPAVASLVAPPVMLPPVVAAAVATPAVDHTVSELPALLQMFADSSEMPRLQRMPTFEGMFPRLCVLCVVAVRCDTCL
jgi:hypothetical protein